MDTVPKNDGRHSMASSRFAVKWGSRVHWRADRALEVSEGDLLGKPTAESLNNQLTEVRNLHQLHSPILEKS